MVTVKGTIMKWMAIDKLGEYVKGREMFVVKAFDVPLLNHSNVLYTTDPYCVFVYRMSDDLITSSFARWPHPFMPTHFCLLPEERE
jgi:hypothetical protein